MGKDKAPSLGAARVPLARTQGSKTRGKELRLFPVEPAGAQSPGLTTYLSRAPGGMTAALG
eukprot:2182923-Amphidinium_carterae.1